MRLLGLFISLLYSLYLSFYSMRSLKFFCALFLLVSSCQVRSEKDKISRCLEYTYRDSNLVFSGIVSEAKFKLLMFDAKSIAYIKLQDKNRELTHTFSMCCYLQPGDSVWKNAGSMKHYAKRGNNITVFYPECGSQELRDSGVIYKNASYDLDCGRSEDAIIPY